MKVQLALLVVTAAIVVVAVGGSTADAKPARVLRGAAIGSIRPATLTTTRADGVSITRTLPFVSASVLTAASDALASAGQAPALAAATASPSGASSSYGQGAGRTPLCLNQRSGGNVRVNQDCGFRAQNTTAIAVDPTDSDNLLAGQNDDRVGLNQCGIDFSLDGGRSWNDLLPPFRLRLNNPDAMGPTADAPNTNTILGGPGTIHSYDTAADPSVTFDSRGRGFFSCVIFDVASNASGLFVTGSPQGANGSFFNTVPEPPGKAFMVVEDDSPLVLHDRAAIVADASFHSPNRDNVYAVWTVFRFDEFGLYQQSPIYGSMSTDHAVTWSTPQLVSGSADGLCFFGDVFDPTAGPSACNFDQAADPAVLPNGDLAVVFNSANTPSGDPNAQQLAVLCHPSGSSTDGSASLNCGTPRKVGDDVTLGEPQCDFGRGPEECIPGPYLRTNDGPRIVTNTPGGHVYAVWQDYRNSEFDIQLSQSLDGGATWQERGALNQSHGRDHFFPAVDQSMYRTDRLGASYYRSRRVANENTTPPGGFTPQNSSEVGQQLTDYVLAGGSGGDTPWSYRLVAPPFPPPDGIQTGFLGDYTGLAIDRGDDAHPIWSDTRSADPYAPADGVTHDEDIFTDTLDLPFGH